ncbi:N-acetyltransferase family protein [Carnobacterium gallinarum]|uniref:GNAT family N-acetyltransferase n=1 Tax=Carnobacterium gallinarum TaxID=2749 RepID=UPI0005528EEB|nr:GNAT family N-acetyltransferase [Carnobacterium gallinarum]
MEIRLSELKDYEGIVAIENVIWNDLNTPAVTEYNSVAEYILRFPTGSHLVAVEGEDVLGILGFHHPTSLPAHKGTWLLDIGVSPAAQGKGVGQELVAGIKELARFNGIHKLSLRVLGTNVGAIRFYLKNGFVEEGLLKEEFWINGQYVDDVFMGFVVE